MFRIRLPLPFQNFMTDKLSSAAYDLVVVGAGIIGLAHAYVAARSGLKVCVRRPRLKGRRRFDP